MSDDDMVITDNERRIMMDLVAGQLNRFASCPEVRALTQELAALLTKLYTPNTVLVVKELTGYPLRLVDND